MIAVLVGLSGELWNLMSKTKMHVLLPFVVGGAVAVSHLVLVPIGEHSDSFSAQTKCNVYITLTHWVCSRQTCNAVLPMCAII
jgi:hypothetical protein